MLTTAGTHASTGGQLITTLSATQLRRAADIQEKIESLNSELSSILGANSKPDKRMGRPPGSGRKGKRTMSAAARARIAAAARARWKKAKAAGKNTL